LRNKALSGYYQLDAKGHFDRRGFRRIDTAPTFTAGDPEVKLLDLDGDGVTDAVRSGADFECFFARHQRGWDTSGHFGLRSSAG
jgi:hypothetical protein